MAESPNDARQPPVCSVASYEVRQRTVLPLPYRDFTPIAPLPKLVQASQNASPQLGRLTPGVDTCQSCLQLALQLLDTDWEM